MIVTVDEVKTHLRIQHDEEDDYIESLIKQAQTAAGNGMGNVRKAGGPRRGEGK